MAEKDPKLTDEQNQALDDKIAELINEGYAQWEAEEAAPIMIGLSDGDVIEK